MTLEIVRYTTRSSHGDGSRPDVNLSNSGPSGRDNNPEGKRLVFPRRRTIKSAVSSTLNPPAMRYHAIAA
jgi:hypothetical protein